MREFLLPYGKETLKAEIEEEHLAGVLVSELHDYKAPMEGTQLVQEALEERGYNSVNQLAGYLISNDPAYISSHKNARTIIQSVERYEIIEELVRAYLEDNE